MFRKSLISGLCISLIAVIVAAAENTRVADAAMKGYTSHSPLLTSKNRIGRDLRFRNHNNRSSAKKAFRSRDRAFRRMAVVGPTHGP